MYFKALRLSATLHSDIWILFKKYSGTPMSLPCGSAGKQSDCNEGDLGSIPGLGGSPGEGNGNPLQYSCLENPWTEEPGGLQSTGSQRVGHN